MVMNQTISVPPLVGRRRRRLGVAEAKARLSELLRDATAGPTVIHSRGRDVAVVLAIEDYDRLAREHDLVRGGGALFLDRIDALKARQAGGIDDFEPERLDLALEDPFGPRRRKR